MDDAEHYAHAASLKDIATPDQILARDELNTVVFAAMEKLPEELRTAIRLRELEGLSYEDIGEVMQCPIGTVRSRIFRAREAIDKAMAPLLDHTKSA